MQVSIGELNLIVACLRAQSMDYEKRAKELAAAHGSRHEVQRLAVFARACGELSDRLEREHSGARRPAKIIRPH